MYYNVKLNVPQNKADAIKALVPPGEPVSGTLIAILLDVAASRGIDVTGVADSDAAWRREIARMRKRLITVEQRLDEMARLLGKS